MQGEPWSGEHRRGIAVCGLLKTTNSAASSKQAHFFRHWRRITCFPCFSIRPAAGGRFAKQIKEAPIKRGHPLGCPLFIGAGGGTRTHTVSPPTDFESVTSTIPSHRREVYYSGKLIRIQVKFQNLPQKSEKHPPKSQIPLVISGNLE